MNYFEQESVEKLIIAFLERRQIREANIFLTMLWSRIEPNELLMLRKD
jgi:hypothetical protein